MKLEEIQALRLEVTVSWLDANSGGEGCGFEVDNGR